MEPLIFKRLAIHGVSFTSHLIANDKIKWVIDKDFLFVHGLKHEIFQLLKNAYPNADLKWRKILLDEAIKKIDNLSDQKDGEHKEYIINLLYWLSLSAPDCRETDTQLALVKKAHPDFQPRKYPDPDHYFFSGETGSGGPRSPVSVEELLKKRPSEWFEYFMTFKGDAFDGPDRGGLIYNISKAVYQDFEWGRDLADLLFDKNKLDSDVLGAVIRGWYDLNLLTKQWEYILTILSSKEIIRNHFQYITNLLQYGVKKEEGGIPAKLLLKADSVALKIWDLLHKVDDGQDNQADRDFSHLGGELAMFWIYALSRSRKEKDKDKTGIFQPYRDRFETIINGDSEAAAQGLEMLASQLGFIYSIDQKWSRMNIIPLFNWDNDVHKARKVWEGWLGWGRLTEPLLDELIPFFKKSFHYISTESPKERERLVEWIAGISLFWMDDPLNNGWITDFLKTSNEQDRKNFASQIGHNLMSMKIETKIDLWKRWLKRYWEERNQGIPVPLGDGELIRMVEWASELGCVFPDVVEIICSVPIPKPLNHMALFSRLEKKDTDITKKYPNELARLLIHLTGDTSMPRYFCGELEKLTEKIITSGVQMDLLHSLCDNLAAIGCERAAELSSYRIKL